MIPPPLFDTHCHLDAAPLALDVAAVWDRARAVGVVGALAVGVDPRTWSATESLAALDGVRIGLGIHPEVVPSLSDDAIARALAELPERLVRVGAAALGECGLDGPSGELDRQKRVLRAQLDIARALGLPVSLHVLGVQGEALAVLRDVGPLPRGGIVHSYSGSAELVREYVRLGWSIGFAGAITRSNAKRPALAAAAVPADFLVIETDAPYQPAGPDRRELAHGEPKDLPLICEAVAHARKTDVSDIAQLTTSNALRLLSSAP